jgi:hypothetical protein
MDTNEFKKRAFAGEYLDVDVEAQNTPTGGNQIRDAINRTVGVSQSGEPEEIFLLEFCVDLNLYGFEDMDEDENETGIKLPYVVTLAEDSGKVVGVRRNWLEEDELKKRREFLFIMS